MSEVYIVEPGTGRHFVRPNIDKETKDAGKGRRRSVTYTAYQLNYVK